MTTNINQIILVGAGDTNGTPSTTCLYSPAPCQNCTTTHKDMHSSSSSQNNINQRYQTSILLEFNNNKNILVDCGLTFRDSALKSAKLQSYQFPLICGFIATRNAPDSILGSDDIREVTQRGEKITFLAPANVTASMQRMFPYIMPSKTGKSENQKNLWTAGLTPMSRPLKQAEKFAVPVGDVAEIELVGVGKSEKASRDNCGFVISLEEDGKLVYPSSNLMTGQSDDHDDGTKNDDDDDAEDRNKNNTPKLSKVALYLPFDCLSDDEASCDNSSKNDDHYSTSTVDVLSHFDIEIAFIACPSIIPTTTSTLISDSEVSKGISDLIEKNWKGISIKKIVVCSIPHNVVVSSPKNDDGEKEKGKEEGSKNTISFGIDATCVWTRSS